MANEYLDDEGYPTEKALKEIEEWEITNFHSCRRLLEFIQEIWWQPEWGISQRERPDEFLDGVTNEVWEISTGGWSGNESIIYALQKNTLFWMFCWESHRRGGHYVFSLRKEEESG